MSQIPLRIEDIVSRTTDLPSVPGAVVRVMKETRSATADATSVAQLLALDQALSARVLRLANSPFYGLARRIETLRDAVVVLGMKTVRDITVVAATYSWMSRPLDGYALGPQQLWTHSFGTALGAELAAKRGAPEVADIAFTAGLMHDIGKVALSVWLEDRLEFVIAYAEREGVPFDRAERSLLGFDHAEVGAFLGQRWNLPESLISAIRYHHEPSVPASAIVDAVHVGNYLTMALGFGIGGDGMNYKFDDETARRLELDPRKMDRVAEDYVKGYEQYERLFTELKAA